ncbi:hypothetical protein GGR58DRAFT_459531 [Xylaria digitata]|nr:hypothetical protein GGR58DRAFT_459531 [Xylaria digitata]
MVNPAETSKLRPEPQPRNDRFDRIEIWRHEVAASCISCVCSAPTMKVKEASVAGNLYRSMTRLYNPLANEDESPLRPQATEHRGSSRSRERTSGNCDVCASPVDGVTYKLLSDGYGLLRARGSSPQSLPSSIRCLEDSDPQKREGVKALLKKVSQAFRRKGLDPLLRSIEPTGRQNEIDANALGASISMTAGPHKEVPRRKTGTEMYYRLRLRGRANDDQEDESSGAFSDDDRKRPKVGIDESAARLRRAQKLLTKGTLDPQGFNQ